MSTNRSPRSARWHRLLYRWAVPALLTGVALQQMLWVYTAGLNPWKGGGFGMFSKIEMRLLRAQVVRGEEAPYSIDLTTEDPFFERMKGRAIAMPDEAALTAVAQAILDTDFVPVDYDYHVLRREFDPDRTSEPPAGAWRRYRMRSTQDSWLGTEETIRFQKVRVQVWRFRFDSDSSTIGSESVGPIVDLER